MALLKNYAFKVTLSIVLGVLTFFVGLGLGFASLISVPVKEVNVIPVEDRREEGVYYLRKGVESPTGARWRLQRTQVLNSQIEVVRLTEPDLNDWARTHFDLGDPAAFAALINRIQGDSLLPEMTEEDAEGMLAKHARQARVIPPNFAIVGDQLQITTAIELMKEASPRDRTRLVYHVTGQFEEVNGSLEFVVSKGFLGAVPLYHIPLVGAAFHQSLMKYFSSFDEWGVISTALENVSSAEVIDGELVLTLRTQE